jgi:hypothetical protein
MALANAIFVTLSMSSFFKPDFMEGRWLVNNITGFIEFFFFCKEFPTQLKSSLQIDSTTKSSMPVLITVSNKSSKTRWNCVVR